MAADSSIYGQIRTPQAPNKLAQYAEALQLQSAMDAQQFNRLKVDEYQRERERSNKLTELLGGGADAAGLRKAGYLKEAGEWEKNAATVAKDNAEAEKKSLENASAKIGLVGQILGSVRDQASWDQARATAQQHGLDVSRMPLQFDPAFVNAKLQETQTVAQRLEQEWKKRNYDMDVRKQGETERHNRNTESNAAGNLSLRRQELDHSRSQPKGQIIETEGGFMLADPRAATATPLTGAGGQQLKGKAATRQMTDAQAKANLFGSRMKESDRILQDLEGKYSPMAVNAKMAAAEVPLIGGAAGYAGNLMLSEQGQQAEQAQRDFINAVLRRESGAVISPQEFANGQKQYFPQPGDSKAVLDQKRRNRTIAISGMEAEVPGGLRSAPSLNTPGNSGGADGGWSIQKVN